MDPAWAAPAVATLHDLYELSPADPGRSSLVHSGLPQAASYAPAPRTLAWHAPVQSVALYALFTARVAESLAHYRGCALSPGRDLTPTRGGGVGASSLGVDPVGACPSCPIRRGPPFGHDGTERPIPRPTDATEQKTCSS